MKVVYDISLLGEGHVNPAVRTGIHRYAMELFLALIDHPEVGLVPAASQNYELARQFMGSMRQCHGLEFSKPSYNHLRNCLHPLLGPDPPKLPTDSTKVSKIDLLMLAWAISVIRKVIPKIAPLIAPASLRGASIYHSPFHELPMEVPERRNFSRVFTIHDLIPIRFPYFFGGAEEQVLRRAIHLLRPSDYVICDSESTRNDFLNFTKRLKPEQVHVCHLGVNRTFTPTTDKEKISEACQEYGIDPSRPYVMSLCTLEPRKNLSIIIQAMAQLRERGLLEDFQLVLAGGKGWMLENMEASLESTKVIRDSIVLTGRIDDKDLSPIYSGATAFLYPSLYEGFGLPPLEAMSCGTAVITSNTSSIPEVVGDAALLIDPRSIDQVAEAILRICEDGDLRADLQKRGLERAQNFTWENCANKTVKVYQQIHPV